MGREIRRVPANWEHPKDARGRYIPLYKGDYTTEAREWLDECIAWDNGSHPELVENPELKTKYPFYWEYYMGGDPPERDRYCDFTSEPTWYQVYETVSEGTPVSPPFATKEELINYLVEHGDFWDQRRGDRGWFRKNAEQFVEAEWAPSGWIYPGDSKLNTPRDGGPK